MRATSVRAERLESRLLLCSGQLGVLVNAGGPDYLDAAQNSWAADSGFSGGSESQGTFAVKGTAEQGLYESSRSGADFTFQADSDSGGYTLTLLFAEPTMEKAGLRVFNVFAQGKEILKNFDLFKTGGSQTAISKNFSVTITDNELDLEFKSVTGDAIVSGIELVPLSIAPAKPSGLSATAVSQSQITLNWTDNANNETGFEVDRSPDGKTNWQNVGSLGADGETFTDTTVSPGTTYYYRVQSVGQYGASPFTSIVSAKTAGTAVPALTPAIQEAAAPAVAVPLATTTPTVGPTVTKIAWTQLTGAAQSPVGRTEAETATVNGKIYCFGGYTDSTLVPEAVSDVFDPTTNTWSALPNMPIGETHAGTCTDGRYIYMAGGYTGPGGAGAQIFAVNSVYKFDTQTSTWSKIQPLPSARGAGTLVLLGRTLHFIGGTDLARTDQTTHWSLNLDDPNATWQTETPLPTARNHLGGVALNGKIYVVAGQQHQDPNFTTVGTVEIWDPSTGKWSEGASLPVTRSHIAGATFVFNGQIIVMGGDHTYLHDVSNVSAYNPITNKWSDLTPLPIARSSGCGTVINGVFYYMTGNISKNCYKGILTLSAPAVAPATPANQTAVANSATQIKVAWAGVTGAGSYDIYRNTDGSTIFPDPPVVVQDTGLASYSYLDNSVTPGKQYFYEVLAVNSIGPSPAPAVEPTATTPLLPTAPTGLESTNVAATEIDLAWNAVAGSISYLLQRSPSGLPGTWTNIKTVTPSGSTTESYSDLSVSPANTYFYEVSVTTAAGTSPSSPAISATTAPVAPTGFAITAVSDGEIDLTWNAVNGALSYDLQTSPTGLPGSWTDVSTVTPSGNSTESYNDAPLSSLTPYFYQISVTTTVATSPFSSAINVITAPPAPTGLQITNSSANEVDLSWTAIAGVTNYLLQRSTSGLSNTWSTLNTVLPSGNLTETYADTTVDGPIEYFYRFSATVSAGVSTPSDSVNVMIPATAPAAPTPVTVSNIQSNQVTLNWSESSTAITGFSIEVSTDDAAWGAPINVGNVTSDIIPSLIPNQTYYFQISAVNHGLTSAFAQTDPIKTLSASAATTVIVDDKAAALVGTWTSGNTTSGFYGTDYLSDGNTAKGTKSATFTPNLTAPGNYQVFARWTAAASRATNVPFDIVSASGTKTVTANQQTSGGVWVSLGTFQFSGGTAGHVTIRTTGTNGYVIADAVEFVPVTTATVPAAVIIDDTAATKVGAWTSSITTSGYYGIDYLSDGNTGKGTKSVTFTPNLSAGTYKVYARWTAAASRATNVPVDILHQGVTSTVTVNQQQNGGVWVLLGTFTFDAGTGGSVTIRTTGTNGFVIADAVEFVPA